MAVVAAASKNKLKCLKHGIAKMPNHPWWQCSSWLRYYTLQCIQMRLSAANVSLRCKSVCGKTFFYVGKNWCQKRHHFLEINLWRNNKNVQRSGEPVVFLERLVIVVVLFCASVSTPPPPIHQKFKIWSELGEISKFAPHPLIFDVGWYPNPAITVIVNSGSSTSSDKSLLYRYGSMAWFHV